MINTVWFGDETSFDTYLKAEKEMKDPSLVEKVKAQLSDANMYERETSEDGPRSRLLSYEGNTAIINVNGSLTNVNAWYNSWYGLIAYEEIMQALEEIRDNAQTLGTTQTVIAYASGGGTALGVKECADYIAEFSSKVMPVASFTSVAAWSAAYWLYSAGGKCYVSDMGQLGSIGAISTHVSYKNYLDKQGIVYTVFREGEFKALGQPFEDLDEKAKKTLKERLSKANSFFLDAVISNRKLSLAEQGDWGEGKVMYGREAIALKLADELASLGSLIQRFNSSKSGDGHIYFGDSDMSKKLEQKSSNDSKAEGVDTGLESLSVNLTEEQMKAAAAGVQIPAGVDEGESAETLQGESAEEFQDTSTEVADKPDLQLSLQAKEDELATLKAQLEAKDTKIAELEGKLEEVKPELLSIANSRLVMMGGIAQDLSFLNFDQAMAHYSNVAKKLEEALPVGRRSKSPSLSGDENNPSDSQSAVDPTAAVCSQLTK